MAQPLGKYQSDSINRHKAYIRKLQPQCRANGYHTGSEIARGSLVEVMLAFNAGHNESSPSLGRAQSVEEPCKSRLHDCQHTILTAPKE